MNGFQGLCPNCEVSAYLERQIKDAHPRSVDRLWPFLLAILIMLFSGLEIDSVVLAQEGSPVDAESIGSADQAVPFTLQVGDVVTVSVWKNAELGASVPVRPDGQITLPLVGEVVVLGMTPLATQKLLSERYSDFVTAPAVSVVVDQINSWKVFVLGEVRAPGVYDILRPTRLVQALAMAGGFTEYAKKDEIVLLRTRGVTEQRMVLSVKDITSGRDPDDNVLLAPGDTIIVP